MFQSVGEYHYPLFKVARMTHKSNVFGSVVMNFDGDEGTYGVLYIIGEWSEAKAAAAEAGYRLVAFDSFEAAKNFAFGVGSPHAILSCAAHRIVDPIPPPGIVNLLRAKRGIEPLHGYGPWPVGTIMAEKLRPNRVVYANPMHLAQI